MAKKTAKKPAAKAATEPPQAEREILEPRKVHELFGLSGPYDHQPPPLKLTGFVTFWDPGCSIQTLVKKRRDLFYLHDFPERFAKDADAGGWKQIKLLAAGPGAPYADQKKTLRLGQPAAAREVVTFLLLHFLGTGERLEVPRLRCRDVVASGRRVLVGPFHTLGLDIASVGDAWESPGVGLAEVVVPAAKRR